MASWTQHLLSWIYCYSATSRENKYKGRACVVHSMYHAHEADGELALIVAPHSIPLLSEASVVDEAHFLSSPFISV